MVEALRKRGLPHAYLAFGGLSGPRVVLSISCPNIF